MSATPISRNSIAVHERCHGEQGQIKGAARQVKGAVKEAAGKATGNRQMEAEGAVEKTAGKVQNGFGNAQQKIKDSL